MKPSWSCPHCQSEIASQDINVSTDIALCRQCNQTLTFSQLVTAREVEAMDLSVMPKGFRVEEISGGESVLIFKKISPIVLFLLPFTAVWSGGSMAGIYGSQIKSGRWDWFQCLFGLPFLVGSIFLVSFVLFLLFGSWRFSVTQGRLLVSAGIGPFRWNRGIPCDEQTQIQIRTNGWSKNDQPVMVLEAKTGANSIKFASGLSDEQKQYIQHWLLRAMRENAPHEASEVVDAMRSQS